MNEKGQVIDVIYLVIGLFLFGAATLFTYYIVSQFHDATADTFGTQANDIINNSAGLWSYTDYLYPVFLVMAIIAILVTFLFIPTHPVLLVIEFIILAFIVIFGWVIGNVNQELFNSTELASYASEFPITQTINNNLGVVVAIIGLLALLILFLKGRAEND